MLHTNNQEKQAQHFNWLGNQNSSAIARFQHIYITICRLCTKCQAMDLINNTTKHPSDCFSAEKKLYSGSVTRLCLLHTNTIPPNTNSFNRSPSGPDEPPEMRPENWISLKLLFSPLCAGTSRDNTTKIEPRRTTETQRASEIWVSSWMLGFLFSGA